MEVTVRDALGNEITKVTIKPKKIIGIFEMHMDGKRCYLQNGWLEVLGPVPKPFFTMGSPMPEEHIPMRYFSHYLTADRALLPKLLEQDGNEVTVKTQDGITLHGTVECITGCVGVVRSERFIGYENILLGCRFKEVRD